MTVLQNVMLAGYGRQVHKCRFWSAASKDIALQELANSAMERAGIADLGSLIAKNLGHGVSRQLELAMVLAMKPKMLLLDEPMAGMSQRESEEMTQLLLNLKGEVGILLIEHDLNAVFALADRITVLVYGRAIATGNVDEIKSDPAVREAYLGDEEDIDV
jgi:branched-chain amino acid transport system ATP-binding protein